MSNIAHLLEDTNFHFLPHDIVEPLPEEVSRETYDVVANLASPASPPHYQRLAIETLQVGSVGTQRMLDVAARGAARFFHTSTSEVYGDPDVHPQPEWYKGSVNSYGPRSMYDESKRYAESLIRAYREKYDMNTGVVRIFNTYGPRMDQYDGRVVSNFIVQALQGKPLTVYGDGTQTRSFCYVDDLIEGFIRVINTDSVEGPINLGNPDEFTMLQLAQLVLEEVGSNAPIEFLPLPQDDPTQRKPDISKAIEELGWSPEVPLRTGLKRTIEYFKSVVRG
jgi:UDP-glucuronate decarboxylase